jgi:hypothetical protein
MLTPVAQIDVEDAEGLNISNGTWAELTSDIPGVKSWNGHHDPIRYTPEELRAIAAKHPDWTAQLEWLASEGGAELS